MSALAIRSSWHAVFRAPVSRAVAHFLQVLAAASGRKPARGQQQGDEGAYPHRDDWHEGMDVARGGSRQRLDMGHGFLRHIVRRQMAGFRVE